MEPSGASLVTALELDEPAQSANDDDDDDDDDDAGADSEVIEITCPGEGLRIQNPAPPLVILRYFQRGSVWGARCRSNSQVGSIHARG